MNSKSTFRERVYRTALAALIQAHPDWHDVSLVTHAENITQLSIRPGDEVDNSHGEWEVAA